MSWSKPPAKGVAPSFQALLDAAEAKKKKRNEKKKPRGQPINIFQAVQFNEPETQLDLKFECGCFGTEHGAINNCMNCGRVICAREGERPCPFCGTLVFSDDTIRDPDLLEEKMQMMRKKIGDQDWKPLMERDKVLGSAVQAIDTHMFDLQTDWFDSELQEIFNEPE